MSSHRVLPLVPSLSGCADGLWTKGRHAGGEAALAARHGAADHSDRDLTEPLGRVRSEREIKRRGPSTPSGHERVGVNPPAVGPALESTLCPLWSFEPRLRSLTVGLRVQLPSSQIGTLVRVRADGRLTLRADNSSDVYTAWIHNAFVTVRDPDWIVLKGPRPGKKGLRLEHAKVWREGRGVRSMQRCRGQGRVQGHRVGASCEVVATADTMVALRSISRSISKGCSAPGHTNT